jgi:hypothetical protein
MIHLDSTLQYTDYRCHQQIFLHTMLCGVEQMFQEPTFSPKAVCNRGLASDKKWEGSLNLKKLLRQRNVTATRPQSDTDACFILSKFKGTIFQL